MGVHWYPLAMAGHYPNNSNILELHMFDVCVSNLIRYVLPFEEVIDWKQAALSVDEHHLLHVCEGAPPPPHCLCYSLITPFTVWPHPFRSPLRSDP